MRNSLVNLLLVVGVALTILADIFLKKSGWHDWRWIAAGIFLYGIVAIIVAAIFHYTAFGKLFLIWEALAVIMGVAVASWYYEEPFTAYRLVGLTLALAALYFSNK